MDSSKVNIHPDLKNQTKTPALSNVMQFPSITNFPPRQRASSQKSPPTNPTSESKPPDSSRNPPSPLSPPTSQSFFHSYSSTFP
mmetsp:Transcript_15704/g.32821  ORF Transcript_15704/g.32821 Transcript_15704/m.32821 type:complete len:84 (-) Transcript_15704:650-901(-)